MPAKQSDKFDQFSSPEERAKAADTAPKGGEDRPGFDLGGTIEEGEQSGSTGVADRNNRERAAGRPANSERKEGGNSAESSGKTRGP